MASNPTHLEGRWRATTSERRLWHVTEITGDPTIPSARRACGKSGERSRNMAATTLGAGERVGRFPPHSLNALIGPDGCHAATAGGAPATSPTGRACWASMSRASATTRA